MSSARIQINHPVRVIPRTTSVTARWRVSRAALDRAMPGVVAPGRAHEHAVLEIVIEGTADTEGSDWAATATLIDPRLKTTSRLEAHVGGVRITRDGEHTHVEADGLLSATFRGRDASPVFVRTPLLAAIGVPGGRYELDSATLA